MNDLSEYKEIAALQIGAEFVRLNEEAQAKYKFAPGMRVKFVGGPSVHGHTHTIGAEYMISTVKKDGRVYLKGTTGASAYAAQLEPIA